MRVRNWQSITKIRFVRPVDRYEAVAVGRWGPRWLQRLVWRAAVNLGMIRHWSEEQTITTYRPVLSRDGETTIRKSIFALLDEGFERKDLVVYAGKEAFIDLLRNPEIGGRGLIEEEIKLNSGGKILRRVMQIPLVVLPEIEGILVVPMVRG